MMALVDTLAQMLSERTGTQFEIVRGRLPVQFPREVRMQMRYGLRATRDGVSWDFQFSRPMRLDELTRWLASINDMVDMGYIPVHHDD